MAHGGWEDRGAWRCHHGRDSEKGMPRHSTRHRWRLAWRFSPRHASMPERQGRGSEMDLVRVEKVVTTSPSKAPSRFDPSRRLRRRGWRHGRHGCPSTRSFVEGKLDSRPIDAQNRCTVLCLHVQNHRHCPLHWQSSGEHSQARTRRHRPGAWRLRRAHRRARQHRASPEAARGQANSQCHGYSRGTSRYQTRSCRCGCR